MNICDFIFSKIKDNDCDLSDLEENLSLFLSLIDDVAIINEEVVIHEKRVSVAFREGIRIYINIKEHAPPHFHIEYEGKRASYRIDNCEKLNGDVSEKVDRKIRYWYFNEGKKHIERIWNSTRPTMNQIGFVKERI